MLNLDSLNFLTERKEREDKPTNIEFIYFLFFKEGIDLNRFNDLPIPYIMSILKVASYRREQEEREAKKIKAKR